MLFAVVLIGGRAATVTRSSDGMLMTLLISFHKGCFYVG